MELAVIVLSYIAIFWTGFFVREIKAIPKPDKQEITQKDAANTAADEEIEKIKKQWDNLLSYNGRKSRQVKKDD